MTVLDAEESATAAAEGIARAEAGATDEWRAEALEAVRRAATQKMFITADDVWAILDKPEEPRALGAILLRAARAGWLERTGRTKTTTQVSGHCHPVSIWKSKLHSR
jgi:hypothetical protein